MASHDLPFPRPVTTFVGRDAELARILELLDREPLFFVCGIAGVGKSELVFRSIELARERARWRDARAVLVRAEPGVAADQLVALVRARLSTGGVAAGSTLGDELAALVRALEDQPSFVFIDDAHHVDPASLSQALAYLSRHVRASRLFVASRWEIPIPPGAALPVTIRLDCFGRSETQQIVTVLAARLGIEARDPEAIFERSRGSPFFIQRELVATATGERATADSVADDLQELSDGERSVLLAVSVLHGRVALDALRSVVAGELDNLDEALGSLRRRLWIGFDREVVTVHDLIRDACVKQATEDELHATRRAAARLHLAADLERAPLDVIEAIRYLVAACDHHDAWQLIGQWYRRIAAAGLDHLLLGELRMLRHLLPADEVAIELLEARILIRRSLIADASAVLRRLGRRADAASSFRYLFLCGEVALRAGRVAQAEALFGRATEAATSATDRFQAALERAGVASLGGDTSRANELLDAAIAELGAPSARHRGRWSWSRAANFALAGRFEAAAAAAREGSTAVTAQGLEDLADRLAIVEVIALVQCDRIAIARALVDELAVAAGALREPLVMLARGAVALGAGDMREALVALHGAFDHFDTHGDAVNACIAAYHLAVAHAALGDLERSSSVILHAIDTARAVNAMFFVPLGMAFHARLCLAANDISTARDVATAALGEPRNSAGGRLQAHLVLALASAITGEDPGAELARATACLDDHADAALQYALALDRAEIALMIGAPAIADAELARKHYAAAGRRHDEARAAVVVALARIASGGDADRVLAETALARASELAESHGYPAIRMRVALARAALADDPGVARTQLVDVMREHGASGGELDTATLRAALDRRVDAAPGTRRLLAALGLAPAVVDPRYASFDLVVDVTRGLIIGCNGARTIKGRPITCRVLAVLVAEQGTVVSPETLYRRAWDADDYHPLRHRNTVYVAVNRARGALRELFPDRDLVENAPGGWRLSDRLQVRSV